MKDDEALLDLVRASNTDAYTELYNQFWKSLYAHALKKTGDENDAFDVVQELFIDIWDKRAQIPNINTSLQNYLHGSLYFKLAKYFRTKGFKEQHQRDFEDFLKRDGSAETVTDTWQILENELHYEQVIQVIHTTIDEMPGKMKEIFVMSRSGAYSISEMAELLGVSQQTVKNQVSNALNRLRTAATARGLTTAQISLFTWLIIS